MKINKLKVVVMQVAILAGILGYQYLDDRYFMMTNGTPTSDLSVIRPPERPAISKPVPEISLEQAIHHNPFQVALIDPSQTTPELLQNAFPASSQVQSSPVAPTPTAIEQLKQNHKLEIQSVVFGNQGAKIMIDGSIYSEGDFISQQVQISKITRQGVVFQEHPNSPDTTPLDPLP